MVRPNTSKKNKMKGGSLDEIFEIDEKYLDKIIKTNGLDRLSGTSNAN